MLLSLGCCLASKIIVPLCHMIHPKHVRVCFSSLNMIQVPLEAPVVGMLLLVVSPSVMVAFGTASMMFNKLIRKTPSKFPGICRNIMGMMLLAGWGVGL
jgi:hypothetical protein